MPDPSPRVRRILWTLTLAYWALLFIATHIPGPQMPETHVDDKIEHLVAYGILGALLSLALSTRSSRRIETSALVLIIGLTYGAIDEWLQAIPFIKRSCELADWFADAAGLAIAVAIVALIRALRKKP